MQGFSVEPTERTRDATEALRVYLAAQAARRPLVHRVKKEDLPGGRLLTRDEEIVGFLAAELGVESDLEQYLASHRGRPRNALPFPLRVEPSTADGQVVTNEEMAQIFAEEQSDQGRRLEDRWVYPDALLAQISKEEGSKPGWYLKELGQWLVNTYPWLHIGDAVVFVISGRPPRLAEPISATMDLGTATYSISFSRWVSEDTVLRAYRTIASNHLSRCPTDKTIRVLRFVSEQADEEGNLPSWSELEKRWTATYPDERFWDKSALYKTYVRAVEALVAPYQPLH